MRCFLCFSSDGKLELFQNIVDNDTVQRIRLILPDFSIPESQDHVFICATCLEQISFFNTIKKTSLKNCCRLKQFYDTLKGKNKCKSSELNIIINSDKVSTHCKNHIKFRVNLNSKYLLSSEEQRETHIKEEDTEHECHNQQLVSEKSSLNHLQDDGSSCSSNITQKHENSPVDKFTEKDSNLTASDSRHEDQPKTQRGSQEKRFKCSDCHKTFEYRSRLERHIRVHTGDKPYKCTTCHKTFSHKINLLTHKRIHNNVRPYKCAVCNKRFTWSSSLNAHLCTHTGEKPHECDVCHKTFNHISNLICHKRIHNNERPYKCAVCNKGFTQSSNLTTHMLTHTGEKPHECHLCEYKCAQAGDLKKHIRRHTGEKPYSCKQCDKSFTTSDLKYHKRRFHSNEDSD